MLRLIESKFYLSSNVFDPIFVCKRIYKFTRLSKDWPHKTENQWKPNLHCYSLVAETLIQEQGEEGSIGNIWTRAHLHTQLRAFRARSRSSLM